MSSKSDDKWPGIIIGTVAELRELIAILQDKPFFLYFYTEWSRDCRVLRFEYFTASAKNPNAIYASVNLDHARAVGDKYGLSLDDIPAAVVYDKGTLVAIQKNIGGDQLYSLPIVVQGIVAAQEVFVGDLEYSV